MSDLKTVSSDSEKLLKCLKKFGQFEIVTFSRNHATIKEVNDTLHKKVFIPLRDGKKSKPPEKYLIVFFFACHGVLYEGTQHVVLNEFNNDKKYYKLYPAANKLRGYADDFPNSYIIGIFACCRHNKNANQNLSKKIYFHVSKEEKQLY